MTSTTSSIFGTSDITFDSKKEGTYANLDLDSLFGFLIKGGFELNCYDYVVNYSL